MPIQNGIATKVNNIENLLKGMKQLSGTAVVVGIPASATIQTPQGTISAALLGYLHEFGVPSKNIPARPFLIPTVNKLRDEAAKMLQQAGALQLQGKTDESNERLNALGQLAVNKIKINIVNGGDPPFAPLSQKTIKAKGSSSPLIDTGALLNSIQYAIRKKPVK